MTNKKPRAKERVVATASRIKSLATGVPGFDAVLGGGLPEYSFNLIAGSPGTGKTTLAQQIIFANATAERPALYFTVLGEPTLKMLRYQREFSFFDPAQVGSAIQYLNLSEEALEQDLNAVLDRIVAEVERAKPGIVVVDSFRTFSGRTSEAARAGAMTIDHFIQRLALHLTTWEVTSFLLGEYAEQEQRNPVFTVADGVFWLSQVTDRNSVVRKIQVIKVRGRAPMPGLHTFRITDGGLQIFPRIPEQQSERRPQSTRRLTTGVPGLDEVMGGGIPAGDAVMLAGPAGSGKTTFATQFVAEGLRQGEAVVIVVFEEYPEEYLARAKARNQDMEESIERGQAQAHLPAPARPLGRRNARRDPGGGGADRRNARGDRFAVRLRGRPRAGVPRGLPGIALSARRGVDRHGRHHLHDHRNRRRVPARAASRRKKSPSSPTTSSSSASSRSMACCERCWRSTRCAAASTVTTSGPTRSPRTARWWAVRSGTIVASLRESPSCSSG